MQEVKKSFYDYTSILFGNFSSTLLQIFTFTLIVRYLSIKDYGSYNLFLTVANVIVLICVGWTNGTYIIFGKKEFIEEKTITKTYWGRLLLLTILISIILFISSFLNRHISSYIGIDYNIFLIIALYIISYTLLEHNTATLQVINKMKLFSILPPINKLFLLISLILFFYGYKTSLIIVIMATIASNILAVFVSIFFINKNNLLPIGVSKFSIFNLISISYPYFFSSISAYIVMWIDIIVVRQFMGIESVGIYSFAYKLSEYLVFISQSFSTLALPILTSFVVKKRFDLVNRFSVRIFPQFILAWNFFIIFILFFGNYLILLVFGDKYILSIAPFYILLTGSVSRAILMIISPIMGSFITIEEYRVLIKYSVLISIIESIINLFLDYLLIIKFQLIGPAIATSMTFFIGSILFLIVLDKKLKIKIYSILLYNIPILISLFVVYYIDVLIFKMFLFLIIVISLIIYIKISKIISSEDLSLIDYVDMPPLIKKLVFYTIRILE